MSIFQMRKLWPTELQLRGEPAFESRWASLRAWILDHFVTHKLVASVLSDQSWTRGVQEHVAVPRRLQAHPGASGKASWRRR